MNEEQHKQYLRRAIINQIGALGLVLLAYTSIFVGARKFYPVKAPVKSEWVIEGENLETALDSIKPRDLLDERRVQEYRQLMERLEYSPIRADTGNYRRDFEFYKQEKNMQDLFTILPSLAASISIAYLAVRRDKKIRKRIEGETKWARLEKRP